MAGERSEVIAGETDVDDPVLVSFPGLAAFTARPESSDYTIAFVVGELPSSQRNPFMCNTSHEIIVKQH
ncbi:hypothetical protein [Mycobacterium sp. RTGN8]|uniref:hypothetical protein n=1 Tax=Mycobacterium sp. RTGN8 TaxID=3016520 RepID=UPI0029C95D7B|nr:hypothetical protein [Mycobacterium sp. RTGN8]